MMSVQIIDLSLPLQNFSYSPNGPQITYYDHAEGARRLGKQLGVSPEAFPDSLGLATETLTLFTHCSTHMDAPYHYGPTSEGEPALTIDEVPLDWCYGDGVVLDLTHKKAGELISAVEIEQAVALLNYTIKAGDIILIRTDAYKRFQQPDYDSAAPGMSREATLWLINQGVRVMGIDSFTFDRPFNVMKDAFFAGEPGALWPAHFTARDKTYFHIESLANLDKIPVSTGFKVAAFPIKVEKGSAGWVRAVAIVNTSPI